MIDETRDASLSLHSFSIPVDGITLSKATASEDGDWVIEGLASTPSRDQQNEVVLVKGLDLSYLEEGRGTFNWNHRGDADPSSVVGVITHCERTPQGQLLVKGKLLKSLAKAKHVYQLMKALAKDCPERQMGMSIEGKVLARNGNMIVKAWVKAVALTLDPVNKDTWVTFAKSMDGMEWAAPGSEPLVDAPVDLLESAMLKALSVGATTAGSSVGASILTPESLESEVHPTVETPKSKRRKKKGEKMNKSYSFDEAVALLRRTAPTMSDRLIHHIVSHTFRSKGQE